MRLNEELEKYAREKLNADLFGVADLRPVHSYIKKEGGEFLDFPHAISAGIHISDSIVDKLIHHDSPGVQFVYTQHIYATVTHQLDDIALKITQKLQRKGYRAFPIPSTLNPFLRRPDFTPSNPDQLKSVFSHKLSAHLAGLGWIGKNTLLITPEYGPRVRLVSILTDAPLAPGKPMEDAWMIVICVSKSALWELLKAMLSILPKVWIDVWIQLNVRRTDELFCRENSVQEAVVCVFMSVLTAIPISPNPVPFRGFQG